MDITFKSFGDEAGWVAWINSMPGTVVQGDSREHAFNELMVSLVVALAYKYDIKEITCLKKVNQS